jgi:hypothetical protein
LGRTTPRLAANKKLSAWFDIALFAPLHRQNGPQMEAWCRADGAKVAQGRSLSPQSIAVKTINFRRKDKKHRAPKGEAPIHDAQNRIHPIRKYQVNNGFKLYLDILFPRGLRGCTDKVAVYGRRNSVSCHDG